MKKLLVLTALACLTGCANLQQALAKGELEYEHSRTPLKSSYMDRLKARIYGEKEASNKGISNPRVKSAYVLDCLHRLDWL